MSSKQHSKQQLSSEQVDQVIDAMNELVRNAPRRRLCKNAAAGLDGKPVDWNDPFEELARREEQALRCAAVEALDVAQRIFDLDTLPQPLVERIHAEVFEEFRQFEDAFMEWLFAAGPQPLEVMRRLFAYAKKKRASLLWNMGFRHVGPLLGETHANAQLRCRELFPGLKTGWNKPVEAVEKMRAAQKGNNNRLGGKKARPPRELSQQKQQHKTNGNDPHNGKHRHRHTASYTD